MIRGFEKIYQGYHLEKGLRGERKRHSREWRQEHQL